MSIWCVCDIIVYPKVREGPLALGDDAKSSSAEANVLTQKLHKLHSPDQTITTVQDSWYCKTIICENIRNASADKARIMSVYHTHRWARAGGVSPRSAPQVTAPLGSPPGWSPQTPPENLGRSARCTYSSSLVQLSHPHPGISLQKHSRVWFYFTMILQNPLHWPVCRGQSSRWRCCSG